MTTIHLSGREILPCLRGSYTGNKFQVRVCESVEIPMDAGLWSGGSRSMYYGVDLLTGERSAVNFSHTSPFNAERRRVDVKLSPGKAVVEHVMFCGKDLGLHIYLHPENATKLLPQRVELDPVQQRVLNATAHYKSSYGGRDRYQMSTDFDRSMGRSVPSRELWETAKMELIARGLLNARGAITIAGRNAVTR